MESPLQAWGLSSPSDRPAQERSGNIASEVRFPWLQSRRMNSAALSQQSLITAVFEASNAALDSFTQLVPEIDRDQVEYALATLLLEEAWVAGR